MYLLTLVMVLSLNFLLVHLMPGDPLVHLLGEEGYARLTGDAASALRAELGLDDSMVRQYGLYLIKIGTGKWGWSHRFGQPVFCVIASRLQWTLVLLVPALVVGTLAGGWLGAVAGWRHRDPRQRILGTVFLCLYAIPAYCVGLVVLVAAACWTGFPLVGIATGTSGFGTTAAQWLLPFTVVAFHGTAYKYIIMRHLVRHEIDQPYVATALSKGLTDRQVLFGHILPNALPAFLAVVALNLGFMVGGTLLVEVVFCWQGMGALIYQAVLARDYPMLSGALTALAVSVLAANGLADLVNRRVDPRIAEGVPVA
ncbi:ABC transporter permease [Desulfosarcina ovata subsp. sediminis]|uniref:ABC transporter permease n=1 Tax=Desulfosarcina ovata subsp. sediminis TaxID=885957 RepID=A0A5K7ZJB9_9BACT|nr:ABC transporter permease [Desulfosarcina ovata subsp. sediminis]